MADDYITRVRIKPENWEYISKHFDNANQYINKSAERDRELSQKNHIKNTLQNYSFSFVMIGIGAIFLLMTPQQNFLLNWLILFILSVFFIITGLVNILLGVREHARRISR